MTEEVKGIFKVLIKIPIIIMVSYFIFNIFTFTYSYFKLLGLSYVVVQTGIENNFIPEQEANTLVSYAESMESKLLPEVVIGCDVTAGSGATSFHRDISAADASGYNYKVQYGTPITVSVSAKYTFILPFINTESREVNGDTVDKAYDGLEYNEVDSSESSTTGSDYNIVISYTIPGLKYYPDED